MAVNIGLGERTYQKTEVFDTPGNHTWTHPLPGQNIEVFVEAFGGGGGSQKTSGVATDGGDTIWDTASESLVIDGGAGVDYGNVATTGINGKGLFNSGTGGGGTSDILNDTVLFTNGSNEYGAAINTEGGGLANVGDVKRFSRIVNGDINLTVGTGGIGNSGNGKSGAIIISYNITTTQTPVVVNMQRRDWEHFGEITQRQTPDTVGQLIADEVPDILNLKTEVLDTGNKVVLNGDNTFTLQAGTYEFDLDFVAVNSLGSTDISAFIYNVSDSVVQCSQYYGATDASISRTFYKLSGIISIPSAKTFRIEALTATSVTYIGGFASNPYGNGPVSREVDVTKFKFKWRP
jgi:hypothetical protein